MKGLLRTNSMGVRYNHSRSASRGVKVGDRAPDFTLPSLTGEPVSLESFLGKKNIVLYFYPKDDTPGCTAEACSFRDSYEAFQEAGAEVVGVSSDSEASHQRFANKYKLPYILLSDKNGELRKKYGVPTTLGFMPGRVTYVIDKEGIVRHIFSSQFAPEQHIVEAIRSLQETTH